MDDLTKLVRETRDILDRMERRISDLSTHIDWATYLETHSALDPIDINAFSKPIVHKVTMPPSAPKDSGKAITIPADVWEGFQRAVNSSTERRGGVERREGRERKFLQEVRFCGSITTIFTSGPTQHTCRRVRTTDRRKP